MKNYYQILGVHRETDEAAIKEAYRLRAKTFHPDHGGDTESFTLLNEAYAVLAKDMRREAYVKGLKREFSDCDACNGRGCFVKQVSFTRSDKTRCEACSGSGVIF